MKISKKIVILSTSFLAFSVAHAQAEEAAPGGKKSNEQISRELSNPVAHLISVPFQFNPDYGGGPDDNGKNYTLKIQPVVPFTLSDSMSVISRTIVPLTTEHDLGVDSKTGLGDVQQTFFFVPKTSAIIWGAGPVFQLPTATEQELGQKKWGAGPSAVVVKKTKDWTLGTLTNHVWSFAGDRNRNYVSQTLLQPFIARHFEGAVTVTLNSETIYDWHENEATVPLNLTIGKVVTIGKMPVNFSFGGRYYVNTPSGGPDWGLRAQITMVFPK